MCEPDSSTPASNKPLAGEDHSHDQKAAARTALQRGTMIGAASLSLVILANSLTLPHQQGRQDELGCDSLCVGSMRSARSALTLVGATLIGKWSDSKAFLPFGGGRKIFLWLGVSAAGVSIVVANRAASSFDLWMSLVPCAFQQNGIILRALLGEYQECIPGGSTPAERASCAGTMGMSVGLAMMVGPMLGASSTSEQATNVAILLLAASATLIGILPTVSASETSMRERKDLSRSAVSFFELQSMKSPAALFLLTCRVLSTLGYQIYQTVWAVYMKEVLKFGPRDYGYFFTFSGLCYAMSQGFVAKFCLNRFAGRTPRGRVRLLLLSVGVLALMRFVTFQTVNLFALYAMSFLSVTSWGVTSTILSADMFQVVASDELGTFFGLQSAAESAARMAGPVLGGSLAYIHPTAAPLLVISALNAAVFIMVSALYDRFVLRQGVGSTSLSNEKEKTH